MEYSSDKLQEAERLGAALFDNEQIAKYLDISVVAIHNALDDVENPLGTAIEKGRMKTEIELRESIIKSAKNGSTPAQTTAIQFLMALHA